MVTFFVFVLLSSALGANSKVKIIEPDGLKYIPAGENIVLTCTFPTSDTSATVWLRQTPGEKPLMIASAYYATAVIYGSDLQKTERFSALKIENSFTLNISNSELSDSATYYCAVAHYMSIVLDSCTVIVTEGFHTSHYTSVHQTVLDPILLGDNITIQCTVLTRGCAGEHSVYWFKHGSGESHPGIIYTDGGRSDQCNKGSDADSPTKSCVYNLPKRNLSISDAGTYYCAVAMCGEILYGNGTNLDFKENSVLDPILVGLATSNIITLGVILFMCMKSHKNYKKDCAGDEIIPKNQTEDTGTLNYVALSFAQPPPSRRSRAKITSEQAVYAQVMTIEQR